MDGRRDRRYENGGVASEEPGNFDDPFRKASERGIDEERKVIAAIFGLFPKVVDVHGQPSTSEASASRQCIAARHREHMLRHVSS